MDDSKKLEILLEALEHTDYGCEWCSCGGPMSPVACRVCKALVAVSEEKPQKLQRND